MATNTTKGTWLQHHPSLPMTVVLILHSRVLNKSVWANCHRYLDPWWPTTNVRLSNRKTSLLRAMRSLKVMLTRMALKRIYQNKSIWLKITQRLKKISRMTPLTLKVACTTLSTRTKLYKVERIPVIVEKQAKIIINEIRAQFRARILIMRDLRLPLSNMNKMLAMLSLAKTLTMKNNWMRLRKTSFRIQRVT